MDTPIDESFPVLPHHDLTSRVIAAAIDVHRALGPGYLEAVYARALAIELEVRAIPFEREHSVTIAYRGQKVGRHVLDLVVARCVVVELKAAWRLDPVHFGVVRSYLRATGLQHGLLLNFGAAVLDVRRVIQASNAQQGR